MSSQKKRWTAHYTRVSSSRPVYPTEWVVRTLAGGNYPRLKLDRTFYPNSSILDLGCGDGRNLRLLQDLGFRVHASELSEDILNVLRRNRRRFGWRVRFKCGTNSRLPYRDATFDYVLACSSFYYLDNGATADDVLKEIARVLKPAGFFIANIPDLKNSVTQNARVLPDGTILILQDPFRLRNGVRWIIARNRSDVQRLLSPYFTHIRIGRLIDDFFGLLVSGFIFVCRKAL